MWRPMILSAVCFGLLGCQARQSTNYGQGLIDKDMAEHKTMQSNQMAEFSARTLQKNVPAELKSKSEASIKDLLKDPDSAKFRMDFLSKSENSQAVCGAVNAKNAYGGYVGMKRFYVEFKDHVAIDSGMVPLSMPNRMLSVCGSGDPASETNFLVHPT